MKKFAMLVLVFGSCFGSLAAQMAMPEMVVRSRENDRLVHVPQSTWSQNGQGNSAESARPVVVEPEHFSMHLFPNPGRDQVRLELFLPEEKKLSIELVDREGKFVRRVYDSSHIPSGNWGRSIPLDRLAAGIYYLKIRTGDEFHSLPVVKL